ncbi:ubiquinone biosynthesis protein COQ3, mitochondrial isoform X2 [Megachile rotundata]|uniref:ubiquinone biosynthesis protein COQ3, mitochondrial isoform X2 n=1 Tax=Megachile rotundata TaxID=143995 RepID=UPI0006150142|nr:PREDICTED: hexaprenyldihydroxybenzoate methyltransferase, mitochondrial isoform X3 [Megachile rotundata]
MIFFSYFCYLCIFKDIALINEQIDQLAKPTTIIKKSTVDLATVDLHSKLSNKWWDIKGEMRALHALNPLRVQFVRDGLANTGINIESPHLPLEGIKILDVGCGGGLLSEPLARIGAEVTGIDASSELITVAKEHAALDSNISGRLNYIQTVIEDFAPTNSKVYNAVIASEVVEHVNEKELFLKCCVSTLKPDGSIFLTTLNKTLPSWLGGIIAAEYVLKLVPKGTHDWNKFISPAEMQRLLETYGCKTKLIHGMFYNPLKNEWSWVASRAINYAIHAVKRKE